MGKIESLKYQTPRSQSVERQNYSQVAKAHVLPIHYSTLTTEFSFRNSELKYVGWTGSLLKQTTSVHLVASTSTLLPNRKQPLRYFFNKCGKTA